MLPDVSDVEANVEREELGNRSSVNNDLEDGGLELPGEKLELDLEVADVLLELSEEDGEVRFDVEFPVVEVLLDVGLDDPHVVVDLFGVALKGLLSVVVSC